MSSQLLSFNYFYMQIRTHDTMETIYKYISKDVLPVEYLPDDYKGENAGTIKDIMSMYCTFYIKIIIITGKDIYMIICWAEVQCIGTSASVFVCCDIILFSINIIYIIFLHVCMCVCLRHFWIFGFSQKCHWRSQWRTWRSQRKDWRSKSTPNEGSPNKVSPNEVRQMKLRQMEFAK